MRRTAEPVLVGKSPIPALDTSGDWLIAEVFGSNDASYESVDLSTGTPIARIDFDDQTFLIVTDSVVLRVRF